MLTLLAVLAGCSAETPPATGGANDTAVAPTAAASSPTPQPRPTSGPAEEVARTFLTRAAARDAAGALALWDGGSGVGKAVIAMLAGRDAATIHVDAATGADAGAGQRYVTVPFRIGSTGGKAVLHRVAEGIESDDPHAYDWRIRSVDLAPALPDGVPATAAAAYDCEGGTVVTVSFDNRARTATIEQDGRTATLVQQPAASGIHYAGDGHDLRGKGRDARITMRDQQARNCVAR